RRDLGALPLPLAGEGVGGGGLARVSLVACLLPVPPAEVGFIRLRPINRWPNSGKPEFGCKRGRGRRSRFSADCGERAERGELRGVGARCYACVQRSHHFRRYRAWPALPSSR